LTVGLVAAGAEQPLLATLQSLTHDTEVPCEILVIDDGLRDRHALARATEADSRIRILRTQHSESAVESLGHAIAEGATSMITLLRPGDTLLPGALRTLAEAMCEFPGIGLVHAYCFPVDSG